MKIEQKCPKCGSKAIKNGRPLGKQRWACVNPKCQKLPDGRTGPYHWEEK